MRARVPWTLVATIALVGTGLVACDWTESDSGGGSGGGWGGSDCIGCTSDASLSDHHRADAQIGSHDAFVDSPPDGIADSPADVTTDQASDAPAEAAPGDAASDASSD